MNPTDERIRYWVEMVNKSIGRSDRNADSVAYYKHGFGVGAFKCVDANDYFVVYAVVGDMWGDKVLDVITCYSIPGSVGALLKMHRKIKRLANDNKVKYIVQGSHINNKYLKFLARTGYKCFGYLKEL